MKSCKIAGCEKTHKGTTKGMCWMHYYRERRHGSPHTTLISPETAPLQERLYSIGWDVTESGCWEWAGARNDKGYGQVGTVQGTMYAHRVAYEGATADYLVTNNKEGDQILHSCDNPPCVNPAHLSRGTHADNMADMKAKGRHRGGPNRPSLQKTR